MKWNNPDLLLWLAALIPLLVVSGLLIRARAKRLERLADKGLWPILLPTWSPQRQRVKNMLRLLALALAITALARPQWGFHWEKVRKRGLDIIVALDTSKSMLAQDIKPNRLQQAQWGIRDLLNELKGDRIGLVAFSGDAFLQCPATIDYAAFTMMLDDVYAGIVPVGGTDLGRALSTALDSFEKSEESAADKVIILISDGEGHTGDPMALLPRLKEEGIRVFTIGVGTQAGELIQTSEGFVKDKNGNVVKSALNEDMLKRIAMQTGGFYVRSAPGDFGLERIYKQGLAPLQRDENEEQISKIWTERFQWFLGAALLLLIVETAIRPNKLSHERTQGAQKKRTPGSLRSLVAILFLLLPGIVHAEETPRSAMRKGLKAYKAGDYTNAVALLEKTVLEFPGIGNYNLGNACYRLGEFEKAADCFEEALRTPDLELQASAYFNCGNALLARTTELPGPEQIGLAIECAFQAMDRYEKAMLLDPEDLAAKQNFERASNLRMTLEFNRAKGSFDEAESLLAEFKAKDAQAAYQRAENYFEHILADVTPGHAESQLLLRRTHERLAMLKKAVADAEADLATALQQIEEYQYALAAERLAVESDQRKYAFDIKPDLKKKYEETIQKNGEILNIIKTISDLNIAE